MTMPTSGPISIGEASTEEGLSGQINAGNANLSKLAGVSSGQTYAWSYWYGKSAIKVGVVQGITQYFDIDYIGANPSTNLGENILLCHQTTPTVLTDPHGITSATLFSPSGGGNTTITGSQLTPSLTSSGAQIVAIYRPSGTPVINLMFQENGSTIPVANGALAGRTFITTLGESYVLRNSGTTKDQNNNDVSFNYWAASGNTGNLFYIYACFPTTVQTVSGQSYGCDLI